MGLWDTLLDQRSVPGWSWVWTGESYDRRRYEDSFRDGEVAAAALRARGVQAGATVAAVATNSIPSIDGLLGVWWSGATVASMPIIARGQGLPDYVAQIRRQCATVGARHLLIEDRFAPFLRDIGLGPDVDLLSYEELGSGSARIEPSPPAEDDVVFIQFSSGTTSAPKGIELTGPAIDSQLSHLATAMAIDPASDVGAMWLPLSHDMGFFGGIMLAWYTGMRGVCSMPERFLAQPWSWFDDLARLEATITIGPSFAYGLAARTAGSHPLPAPLKLRLCMQGGEQIIPAHGTACAEAFAPYGLRPGAFTATYGLAEATLAVAIAEIESAPSSLWANGDSLFAGELEVTAPDQPGSRELVSCGPPMPDFAVTHDGEVGELHISGPSLARGYHAQPELTAGRFSSGRLATGDLGFVHEGDVYVVGRLDDRLIAGGRNIDVADLELSLGEDTPVRSGSCAIVDVRQGTAQKIVMVAELEGDADVGDVLEQARTIAARRVGLRLDRAVIVDRGQFPKTPSGKAQRYRCRELALADADPAGLS